VQAADHHAVVLCVEQRDREALIRSRVLERVEADQADVLDAALRPADQDLVQLLHLRHPGARLRDLVGVGREQLVERAAAEAIVAHQVPISPYRTPQAGRLEEHHHDQDRDERQQQPERQRQVLGEELLRVRHEAAV
jgi:hypothetical protein